MDGVLERPSTTPLNIRTNLIKSSFEARPSLDIFEVFADLCELIALIDFPRLLPFAFLVRAQVVLQCYFKTGQERRDSNVCDSVVVRHSVRLVLWKEALECFEPFVQCLHVLASNDETRPAGRKLRTDGVDEETGLRAQDGVFWQKRRLREKVCDELDDDE